MISLRRSGWHERLHRPCRFSKSKSPSPGNRENARSPGSTFEACSQKMGWYGSDSGSFDNFSTESTSRESVSYSKKCEARVTAPIMNCQAAIVGSFSPESSTRSLNLLTTSSGSSLESKKFWKATSIWPWAEVGSIFWTIFALSGAEGSKSTMPYQLTTECSFSVFQS